MVWSLSVCIHANVKRAVAEFGIEYPVALDNNYATWNAYQNSYWPAHYLIDQSGTIRMIHFGEGDYTETENGIRNLLGMPLLEVKPSEKIVRPISPETYLGLARGRSYKMRITPKETTDYHYNGSLDNDQVGLRGPWNAQKEYILAEGDDSYIDMNVLARQVYLVLGGSSSTPLEITLDSKSYGTLRVDGDKKYNIISTTYGRHLVSIKVPKGIQAYAFTFGDEE